MPQLAILLWLPSVLIMLFVLIMMTSTMSHMSFK